MTLRRSKAGEEESSLWEAGVPAAPPPGTRRIIGVDPGLASTGWGLVDYQDNRLCCRAYGSINTKADRPRADRLFFIYREFREVLERWLPGESAVENLYFARNVSSALAVAEARGVLCLALAQKELLIREFSPNAIKKAVVGETSADKRQVQEMLRVILGLSAIPRPDHAADALGAAVCAAHNYPES
jgi:crossover junction endodeoxyribonuclease RuvC